MARQDHVTALATRLVPSSRKVDGWAVDPFVVRQQFRESKHLVRIGLVAPKSFDLLKGDDVGGRHGECDTVEVNHLVPALAPLDVVSDDGDHQTGL